MHASPFTPFRFNYVSIPICSVLATDLFRLDSVLFVSGRFNAVSAPVQLRSVPFHLRRSIAFCFDSNTFCSSLLCSTRAVGDLFRSVGIPFQHSLCPFRSFPF